MIFWIFMIAVPLATYFLLPWWLDGRTSTEDKADRRLLIVAGVLYAVSWYLPTFLIDGKNTSFTTHLVGGGLYCGFVWAYIVERLKMRMGWQMECISLFALVSMLGASNELLELFLVELVDIHIRSDDVWWDITANTSGALLFYVLYIILRSATSHKRRGNTD